MRKFDDSAKNFKPQSEEKHEHFNHILNSICAGVVKILPIIRIYRSTLRFGANLRATAHGLHFWLAKDHDDFKWMAMNKSFPSTQDLIQSVQRQVKTLIYRKDRVQHANLAAQFVGQE